MKEVLFCFFLACFFAHSSTAQNFVLDEDCAPFYSFSPTHHFTSNQGIDEDNSKLTSCDKVYDFHFYTSEHPRYTNRTSSSDSVVSYGYCENVKSVLVYDGFSHPTSSTSSLYTQKFQQHYHSHSRHNNNDNSFPSLEELRKIYHQNSQTPVSTSIGWQRFTLYDFAVRKKMQVLEDERTGAGDKKEEEQQLFLCYTGGLRTYTTIPCMYEGYGNYVKRDRTRYFGGSNYYFIMKGKNTDRTYSYDREEDIRLWAPVADNGDGRYFIKIRVDDPGEYEILVYRDHYLGCATAECDTPDSICNNEFLHSWESEEAKKSNIFMKFVTKLTITFTASDLWPPWKVPVGGSHNANNAPLPLLPPECPKDEIGVVPGRWINPNMLLSNYQFPESHILGDLTWPFVWQPFDCFIPAFTKDCLKNCILSHKLGFSGLSRERTNSFDVEDFLTDGHFEYEKVQNVLIMEDRNYYFPVYHTQIADRPHWNEIDYRWNISLKVMLNDLTDYKLCNVANASKRNSETPLGFLLNEEIYWMSTSSIEERWEPTFSFVKDQLIELCAKDTVTWVYKTSIPVSAQDKFQTWEKFFEITRLSAKLAAKKKMKVIDSFIMGLPLIHDRTVFPDGVHLYTSRALQGNFVSKTTTLMFLRLLCPSC
jgi:hypothetical protein